MEGDVLLGGRLVTVAQVATVRQIQTHQTAVDRHQSLVDLQVGRASTVRLDVDTPLGRVEAEGLEGTPLAEQLDLVDVLVATVVASTRKTLGVLVGHGRAKSIEDGAGGNVLGGDEDDRLPLTLDLLVHDLGDLRVRVNKRLLEHLQNGQSMLHDISGVSLVRVRRRNTCLLVALGEGVRRVVGSHCVLGFLAGSGV